MRSFLVFTPRSADFLRVIVMGVRPRLALCVLLVVLLVPIHGCASRQPALGLENDAVFPLPASLEPNVEFWRNVFAKWSRGQVAIHDNRHLGVVYQVANLPGQIEPSYTPAQREFVDQLRQDWRARLDLLSRKIASRAALTPEEQELRRKLLAAGGPAALENPAERVRAQRGVRERFLRGLEISGRYDQAFRETFRRHGLPEDLAYLPHVESSFQYAARSSVGATGVWQFMRSTGRDFMTVTDHIDERLDPIISADAAARYLASAHRRLGSWPLAITSYNHGVGGMRQAKAEFGDDFGAIVKNYRGRHFGFASRNFYAEFLAVRHVVRHAKQYFPGEVRFEQPWTNRQVRLERAMTVDEVARTYRVALEVLLRANPAWLAPVQTGRVALPAGTRVWLPGDAERGRGADGHQV